MIIFKKVRCKNFFSVGNYFLEIPLNNSRNILCVGKNGSGKSSVCLDSITFSLFGKSFRKVNKGQIVNSINEKDCLTEIEFSLGAKEYLVRRGIKPNIFEIYIDGKLINQDSKLKDYQKYLEDVILKLNFKSFTQIVILGSSTFVPFMKLSAFDRRNIIEDILDIKIFSNMNTVLRSEISVHKERMINNNSEMRLVKEKIRLQEEYIESVKFDKVARIFDNKTKIKENEENIKSILFNIKTLEDKIITHEENLKDKHNIYGDLAKLEKYELQINKKLVKTTKEKKFYLNNDECPTCKQFIDRIFKDKFIESAEEKIKEMSKGLVKLDTQLEIVKKRVNCVTLIEHELSRKRKDIDQYQNHISAHKKFIQKVDEENKKLEREKVNKDKYEEIKKLETQFISLEAEKHELDEMNYFFGIVLELLKDSGIKTKIIRQYLPVINKLVNKYLSIMNFFVDFTLDESFNETIKSRYRDEFSYESFSEGEKTRIDLALLFSWRAIAKMRNSVNTNLIIFDEIFDGSLDGYGTEEFLQIISTLDDKSNIILISHKTDMLFDRFDKILLFEKNNNFTQLKEQGI